MADAFLPDTRSAEVLRSQAARRMSLDRRRFLKGALAAGLVPALAACAQMPPLPGQEQATRRLTIAIGTDPASLDPLIQTGLLEASVYGNIFDALLALDEAGQLQPALAESYRAVDPLKWELKLRRGVTFHSGEPFDSSSVRFTIERLLDPASKSPIRSQLEVIERVETFDAHTAVIVTREPFAPLLAELSALMMLPPKAYSDLGPQEFARKPVGTGPFRFVEWQKDDHLTLEAYAAHWRGSPAFSRLEFRPLRDSASRTAALLAGQVDMVAGVPAHQAASVRESGASIVDGPGVQALYVRFNIHRPPLDDPRVRQALVHAVDVDQVLETVYRGHARRLNGPFPPEVFGYDASAPVPTYDPRHARDLLRVAALPSGTSLVFEVPRGRYPGDEQVPQILAGFWKEVGLPVEIRVVEWAAYLAKLQAGQGEHLFLLAGTNRTFDPHFTVTRLYASSSPFGKHYYGNPRVDALSAEAAATLDEDRRRSLYHQILSILRADVPALWIAQLNDLYGVKGPLEWQPRADSLLWMYQARPVG